MKRIDKSKLKVFFRTVGISSVIAFCLIFGFMAAAKAYENTVRIGYGVYKQAVDWDENGLRIFDFIIK